MADTKIITRSDNAAALTIANHDQNHDSFAGVVEQWTGAATIDINDQNKTIECSSATAFTVTLDALSTISAALHTPNFKVTIKNINSGIITVSANAADDIDGAASMTLGKGQAVTLQTDSGNTVWKVVGGHGLTPGKNFIINGAFDIWQRGTGTFTTNGAYTADRWSMADDSSGAMTVDDDASVPTGLAGVSLKFSNSAAKFSIMRYRMESADSRQLANKFITLSLWAKSDGTSTCDLKVDLKSPTATDDFTSVGSAFNGTTIDASPTATWTYYSVVVGDALTLAEVTDGLQVSIFRDNTDATNASDTYIKNVKLEVGSTATDFSTAGANIAEELAMCQRYYENSGPGDGTAFPTASGTNSLVYHHAGRDVADTKDIYPTVNFRTTKRSTPAITIYDNAASPASGAVTVNGTSRAASVVSGSITRQGFSAIQNDSGVTWTDAAGITVFQWKANSEL